MLTEYSKNQVGFSRSLPPKTRPKQELPDANADDNHSKPREEREVIEGRKICGNETEGDEKRDRGVLLLDQESQKHDARAHDNVPRTQPPEERQDKKTDRDAMQHPKPDVDRRIKHPCHKRDEHGTGKNDHSPPERLLPDRRLIQTISR